MTDWPSFWVQFGTGVTTLGALAVAVIGTYRATDQSKRSQKYIEDRDRLDTQREANAAAAVLAERQAVYIHVRSEWTWVSIERPWLALSVSVFSEDSHVVELLQVELDTPFRHNAETSQAVVFEAGREKPSTYVTDGLAYDFNAQVYLAEGIPQPPKPPVTAIFRDRFGNKWKLHADQNLTLLTPRSITSITPDETVT